MIFKHLIFIKPEIGLVRSIEGTLALKPHFYFYYDGFDSNFIKFLPKIQLCVVQIILKAYLLSPFPLFLRWFFNMLLKEDTIEEAKHCYFCLSNSIGFNM
jgi:hypothetical protein